jgi:hypothetical protein
MRADRSEIVIEYIIPATETSTDIVSGIVEFYRY